MTGEYGRYRAAGQELRSHFLFLIPILFWSNHLPCPLVKKSATLDAVSICRISRQCSFREVKGLFLFQECRNSGKGKKENDGELQFKYDIFDIL
jgi:hypothetical protein